MSRNFGNDKEVSLSRYLQDNISVEDYFSVVRQVLGMLVKLQGEGMQINLDMNMKIANNKVQFQMSAEDSVYEMDKIKNFLKELAFCAVFSGNENCEKVVSFLHYLDNLNGNYSVKTIYDYCNGIAGVSGAMSGNMGSGMSGNMQGMNGSMNQGMSGHMNGGMNPGMDSSADAGETGVLGVGFWKDLEQKYQGESNYADNDAGDTGVLDPDYWNKVAGSAGVSNRQARLVYVKTGQVIPITSDSFWVGKDDVDLQINKDTISRKHAVIITRNGHYFVSDNGSTNKTYVDNREVPAKASVEIYSGTRIKFAKEEYEFQV